MRNGVFKAELNPDRGRDRYAQARRGTLAQDEARMVVYGLLANLVLVVHAAYVLTVVLGLVVIIAGLASGKHRHRILVEDWAPSDDRGCRRAILVGNRLPASRSSRTR